MPTGITPKDANKANCGADSLVISCEHGGNRIPSGYRDLFTASQVLLDSHRGFDPGALSMAKDLSAAFTVPLVASTVSRLLVDLNRSRGNPDLHYETIRKQPFEVRDIILRDYYQPYRTQAERLIRQVIADHGKVIHLSCHSFTPELNNRVRNADIGLLYDPTRPGEVSLCERWKAVLKMGSPALRVSRNYPYSGRGDGLTTWFRQQFSAETYVGVELEINQKHIINAGKHWVELRSDIVSSLRRALSQLDI